MDFRPTTKLIPLGIFEDIANQIVDNIENAEDIVNFRIAFNQFEIMSFSSYKAIAIRGSGHTYIDYLISLEKIAPIFPEGFCYLTAVLKKFQAIVNYGIYIKKEDFIPCLQKNRGQQYPVFHTGGVLTDICHISRTHRYNYHTLRYHHIPTGVILPITDQVIRGIQDHSEWNLHMVQGSRFGGTGTFSLRDLVLSQDTVETFYCPDPIHYVSKGQATQEITVVRDGSNLLISTEDIKSDFNIGDDILRKIPHEYVASRLQENTDLPLSLLGITGDESVLTPDFIDITTNTILELGTSMSTNLHTLFNDFDGKVKKYSYILQPLSSSTFYMIVGMNNIVTNMNITQSVVDDLCARFRIGVAIKSQISDLISDTDISDEDSENVRIVKSIFAEMKTVPLKQTDDYNYDEIISAGSDPTEDDFDHTGKIVKECLKRSRVPKPESRLRLTNYLKTLKSHDCRSNRKRITNVPLVLYKKPLNSTKFICLDPKSSDMPSALKSLWVQGMAQFKETVNTQQAITNAIYGKYPEEKHIWKRESLFKPQFTHWEKLWLAERGVGAKALSEEEQVLEHEATSKLGFDPDTTTVDINDFIHSRLISSRQDHPRTAPHILDSILESKRISTMSKKQDSPHVFKELLRTKLISYFDMVSEIFIELAINYKHWTKEDSYMIKRTASGIFLIIKNTGTHLFITMAFPREHTEIIDTGRLGPTLYTSDNYYYTDFSSYNEPTIEHFVKAGPYITSLTCHLMSKFKLGPLDLNNDKLNSTINFIALVYLNNKLDVEEMLTSQRYLFMKLLEDATQDPYLFTDRLPEVLRSRLSVYVLNQTMVLMDYYNDHKIIKIPKKENDVTIYDYLNIRSIVDNLEITIEEKINEFYYGYVISKERARGSDRTFKIMKKILQEEYKFRDSVKSCFVKMTNNPITYATDPGIMRVTLHYFKKCLVERVGHDFQRTHLNDFAHKLARTSFLDLATLKASARNHKKVVSIPSDIDITKTDMFNVLKESNPDEFSKRPKVLEALINIVKQFKEETGKHVRHVMQLIPWSLKNLEVDGYFDSDIFPKPQHGGDREIHVLDIMARLIQYGIELMSKTFCSYFPSEVLVHPETKGRFVKDHYKETAQTFKSYFVISKSADASKWCQRHHVSHFSAMLLSITHKSLHNYILRSLRLWATKKISFPMQFVKTLLKNKTTISSDETFIRFRKDFYCGTGVMTKSFTNKMEIISGMMQGILHYLSSLYHTMIQEVCRMIVMRVATKLGSPIVCSIVQGSDDSGMMIGVSSPINAKIMSRMYMLLRFKEEYSQHLSVYWNLCKSSIGTIDLIEFNSEWHLRHSIIKPTFRWISACLDTSLTERFIDRYRIFYNVLSQCLEGGASTLECAIVQLCQCWLHYMLIGMYNHEMGEKLSDLVNTNPSPNLGFFPCDFDVCCAIPGIDFILYTLFVNNIYKPNSIVEESSQHFNYEGSDKVVMTRDLKSVKLRFGKLYIWKSLIDRLSLGSLEDAIERVERDPSLIFMNQYSWDDCVPAMILKVFEPGVKESINNVASLIRMMAASAFILDRQCMTLYDLEGNPYQECLLKLLHDNSLTNSQDNEIENTSSFFPLYNEYQSFLTTIMAFTENHTLYKQEMRKTSKIRLKVFTPSPTDHDVMGLCRKAWHLGGKVLLSSRQFSVIWGQTKIQFPFLKDTLEETKASLGITTLELKTLIEKLTLKSREITLMDTTGKESNLEVSISRIYWPDTKIRSSTEGGVTESLRLKSFLFSLTTYWMTARRAEEIATRAISTCHSLDKPYKDIPLKFRKLKTLYDWANHVNKVNLIMQIKSQKQSALGFFSQQQKMRSGKPVGEGYWIGQIVGIPCHILLHDDKVIKIIIKHLSDLKSLGKALILLLKDIKIDGGSDRYSSNVWLSRSGKITTAKPKDEYPIPIEEDQNLIADVITAMEELPWSIQIHNTTIRLIVTEIIDGCPISYTILSESLSSRDWNPDLTINSQDQLLNLWNNNVPANMMEIEEEIAVNIPETQGSFLKFMKTITNNPTLKGWDLALFRSRGLSQLTRSTDPLLFESKSEMTTETMKDIDIFLEKIFALTNTSIESTLRWSEKEDVTRDWESEMSIDITDATLKSIQSFAENLKDTTFEEDFEDDQKDTWYQMPHANRFFSNLEKLCLIQTGKDISDIIKDIKTGTHYTIDGTLGKIISLLCSKFIYKGISTVEETFDVISQSSRNLDTILSETEIANLDTPEILNAIKQLEEASKYLSGMAKTEIQNVIARKRKLLLLKASPTQTSDLEDISYGDFMSKVLNHVFIKNLSKFSHYEVDLGLKLSLVKVELTETIRKQMEDREITTQEHTMMREYINRSVISPFLIDVLQNCYGIKINISKTLFTKSIDDIDIR